MKHDPAYLKKEQENTLATPRVKYGFLARLLFVSLDLFYGRKRTLSKFKVLEIIARVPYQAWEHVAYIAITHKYGTPHFARRIFDFVTESRKQQDNEQWHLLILEELIDKLDIHEGMFRYRILPQFIAFFYYHVSWILYVINPKLSYRLNAHFEDHAEHEYAQLVKAHPEWETEPFDSIFEKDYGALASRADLFRRIGLDEREHKQESLERIANPRFS
ncbi:MAG: hypothetical protein HN919_06165 [Verrucomicrobia bacterium]|nr:hypothetical protein [Verrucomicrobiota bacterium]